MQTDPSPVANKLIEYLGCPCEVFAPRKNEAEMFAAYHKAQEEGQSQGFTPLLIIPDDELWEQMEYNFEGEPLNPKTVARWREAWVQAAVTLIDPLDFWAEFYAENEVPEPGPIEGDNILANFSSHWDYENNQTREIIMAKIPGVRPWELPAWIPMGAFNDCPLPDYQVAIMKQWYEKYGARPVLVSGSAWELTVPQPLASQDEALRLAREHYAFCPDRVNSYARDEYRLGNLADSLMKSKVWFFSWE